MGVLGCLVSALVVRLGSAQEASGFADMVLYSFRTPSDAGHFLELLAPLANQCKENETAFTETFRPFVSLTDRSSVLLVERFVNQAAHDGPHSNSSAHAQYKKAVADWNASTNAITAKVHSDYRENDIGVWSRIAGTDNSVAGFADAVTYTLANSSGAAEYLNILQVLANAVVENESAFTFTFRPFTSFTPESDDDAVQITLLERFTNKSAHDGPHSTSKAHQQYLASISAWNESTGYIIDKQHWDLRETALGILSRMPSQSQNWANPHPNAGN